MSLNSQRELIAASELSTKYRIQHSGNLLVDRKQYASAKDCPSQPHGSSSPKASHAIISQYRLESVHGTGTFRTLRTSLDGVKWLGGVSRDYARNSPIGKARSGGLTDVPTSLVLLEDVIGTHTEGCSGCLFEGCSNKASIESEEAGLGINGPYGVQRRVEALRGPRVVDQGGFDALGWRDGEDTCDDAGGHACE